MNKEITIEPKRSVTFSFRMTQIYNDSISGTQRTQVAYGEISDGRNITLVFPETKTKCMITKEDWTQFRNAVDDMITLSDKPEFQ